MWTFTIRDDAVFSNGEPLTASDVAFTVNSVIESPASEADLSMVERAVAVSDTVVELHLSKPNNTLLYTLAVLGIVPEASYGDDYGRNPIGSGPYVLKQWDQGQQVIFEANPGYYGEAPVMERVIVVFMDEDAALAAVQKGDVDIAYTFATHADRTFDGYELTAFKTVDSRGISLPCIPAGGTCVLEEDIAYHTGNDVTCDVAVRRAINLAIDREQLIDNVLNGYGRPAFSGYYGEAPVMERVIVVFMDEDAALAAVQKGDVDIAYTFATHADRTFDGYELTAFKTVDSRGISLPCIPAGGTCVLEEDIAYHTGNDVTCDVAVRRAINLAIDREQLIDNVLNGYGRPAFSVGDGMPWSSPDMRVECDIDAAKVLLDEAGWKPGADGIRKRDGVRAAFDLWYSSDDSVRQATAHEVANQLAELGIEVKPQGGSWDETCLTRLAGSPVPTVSASATACAPRSTCGILRMTRSARRRPMKWLISWPSSVSK